MKKDYPNLIKCQKCRQIRYSLKRYFSKKVNNLEVKKEVTILKRKELVFNIKDMIFFDIIDSFQNVLTNITFR